MSNVIQFVNQVKKMRTKQQEYFTMISQAKRTKRPEDFANAKQKLLESKQLENSVDQQILLITSNNELSRNS